MQENSFINGKIPVTGNGMHKTYEESIIKMISYKYDSIFNAYNNELFIDELGYLRYAADYNEYKRYSTNANMKKVVIINILYTYDDKFLVELIDPKILNMHLMHEEKLRNNEKVLKL